MFFYCDTSMPIIIDLMLSIKYIHSNFYFPRVEQRCIVDCRYSSYKIIMF